ncbi:MAG: hypothetical protein P8Q94_05630 [Candidatus Poseidoniaceae archaeon]|nr:hypothetical protein [Candidatus Poseidoniaceae archaeon]
MVKNSEVPDLDSALEKSFAEMKIGEENFSNEKVTEQNQETRAPDIVYGQKYSSQNQSGKIIVKPIVATKEVIESGVDSENLVIQKDSDGVVLPSPNTVVVDSPTSTIGDDFAVDW